MKILLFFLVLLILLIPFARYIPFGFMLEPMWRGIITGLVTAQIWERFYS